VSQLTAYTITILIEFPIVLLLVFSRHWLPTQVMGWVAIWGVLASSITHPIAWQINNLAQSIDYGFRVAILELLITLAEGVIYHYALRLRWSRAMVLSLAANVASYGVGMIIFYAYFQH
jgi:hypothetical protein